MVYVKLNIGTSVINLILNFILFQYYNTYQQKQFSFINIICIHFQNKAK